MKRKFDDEDGCRIAKKRKRAGVETTVSYPSSDTSSHSVLNSGQILTGKKVEQRIKKNGKNAERVKESTSSGTSRKTKGESVQIQIGGRINSTGNIQSEVKFQPKQKQQKSCKTVKSCKAGVNAVPSVSEVADADDVARTKTKAIHGPISENGAPASRQQAKPPVRAAGAGVPSEDHGPLKSFCPANEKKVQTSDHPSRRPEDVSSNWKQLIKSGIVKYSKPRCVTQPGTNATSNNSKPAEEEKKRGDAEDVTSRIWFDDVDEILIEPSHRPAAAAATAAAGRAAASTAAAGTAGAGAAGRFTRELNPLVKPDSYQGLTKVIGIDCEMVGVGFEGKDSVLARVSIVNQYGQCVLDRYCRPTERVTDYRTSVSGIRPANILGDGAVDFKSVQKEVSDLLKDRILVGHALHNDLKVLFLDHPKMSIRDTSRYKPFRALFSGGIPSLKKLSHKVLGVQVQAGEHNSIQDAQAAMRLYTLHRKQWEASIKEKTGSRYFAGSKKKRSANAAKKRKQKQTEA